MSTVHDTGCVVVGGGPAGLVLGLLLARAGVDVTVLEKHRDFLRDFRGDTVHASTLTLLDELGLGERFAALPQRRVDRFTVHFGDTAVPVADLGRLPGPMATSPWSPSGTSSSCSPPPRRRSRRSPCGGRPRSPACSPTAAGCPGWSTGTGAPGPSTSCGPR